MSGLIGRRTVLKSILAGGIGWSLASCTSNTASEGPRHVVVVGGGFGGTVVAKQIRRLAPAVEVTLIERRQTHVCGPFSNYALVGLRPLSDLTISYDALCTRNGIRFVQGEVTAIEADRRKVIVNGKAAFHYDHLVMSPGIGFRTGEIEGYDDDSTPQAMPHAWIAGEQTLLLKSQIDAMPDGGVVLITVPPAPYRCPSGPYERASLLAEYLTQRKPRAKILVLDANPAIQSLEGHFRKIWESRYPQMIEYVPGEAVTRIDEHAKTLYGRSGTSYAADVVNLIPPQRAGSLAVQANLTGDDGHWCPVEPDTFESIRQRNIHVIGDAAQASPMPKSGYSANNHAKACALNLANRILGHPTVGFSGINVCYIGLSASETASFAAVYAASGNQFVTVPGAGGVSPLDMPFTRRERNDAESWFHNIKAEMTT